MDERTRAVPDLDAVVHPQARGERGSEEETTIRGPFAVRGVRRVDGADFVEGLAVHDLDFACEVTEARQGDEPALWIEGDEVVGGGTEVVEGADALVKEHRLGRHV